jgi:hypothetical protein
MPKATQVTVSVDDRPGILGEVASALGAKRVTIVAFMGSNVEGRGAIRLIVDKPATAKKVFSRTRLANGRGERRAAHTGR